ncbi:MAG: hypothetical protein ABIO80_01645 [Sphingomicrobium sp.]
MQLAFATGGDWLKDRFKLPPAVPAFGPRTQRIFSIFWIAAFLLALAGPITGIYLRYSAPENNSQLLLGSRAGFAVSLQNATTVRFPVGSTSSAAGIRAGDRIVAVYGLPLPKVMPMSEEALAVHQDDPAYIAMGNLLFGTDEAEVPLTVRSADGTVRDVTVTTGEQHIDAAARALGISPKLLNFIDLLHVISYPFLFWAAWILHRRNGRDAVSSILSLAILLTMSAEQPSATFLATIGVSRGINVALFDLGNVLVLAGILLFPNGTLSWRLVALIASLPILMLLQGQAYAFVFVAFMVVAVLKLLRCMRQTPSSDLRLQIRWALFGFSGYSVLRGVSIACDMLKWSTDSYGHQLLLEFVAGIALGVGVLMLQLGLLIALLRYRLYDAEAIISKTVSVALITLLLGAGFGGIMEGIITQMQNIYPNSQTPAAMIGATLAIMFIEPLRKKVESWTDRKFQKSLFILRDDLPESIKELRETASLDELLSETLVRVQDGVRAVRSALIIGGRITETRNIAPAEATAWRATNEGFSSDLCAPKDRVFPIRVPLVPSSDKEEEPMGYILVGPRPDGSIPSREEQKALSAVSETIARAIRTVIKRQEHEQEVADNIAATNRRIDRIEALLDGSAAVSAKRRPRTA